MSASNLDQDKYIPHIFFTSLESIWLLFHASPYYKRKPWLAHSLPLMRGGACRAFSSPSSGTSLHEEAFKISSFVNNTCAFYSPWIWCGVMRLFSHQPRAGLFTRAPSPRMRKRPGGSFALVSHHPRSFFTVSCTHLALK